MLIKVRYEDQAFEMDVQEKFLELAQSFFARMDQDMDAGWQMSRDWVESPDAIQRCQIAANKLASALDNDDRKTAMMMAGYIVTKMPTVTEIVVDATGEMSGTEFIELTQPAAAQITPQPVASSSGSLNKMQALTQAGKEVSKVFKVGRGYRYSVYHPATDQWIDSATASDKQEAERLREIAFKQRFDELSGNSD